MARRHNKRAKEPNYLVGDLVLLSTRNLKLKGYEFPKLYPTFIGPFRVLASGVNTVTLDVPGSYHNVWNIKRIKRYHAPARDTVHEDVIPPPTFDKKQGHIRLTPLRILKERRSGMDQTKQYLIEFEGYGPEHNSWMDVDKLKRFFGTKFNHILSEFRRSNST